MTLLLVTAVLTEGVTIIMYRRSRIDTNYIQDKKDNKSPLQFHVTFVFCINLRVAEAIC